MNSAFLVITVFVALIVTFSGIGKIRRDQHQIKVIHETVASALEVSML